jgi:ElaB/YqjD/DUF883 family membrane-anchored ribosome-binding protein
MVRGNGNNAVGGEGVPEGLMASPLVRERVGSRAQQLVERARELPENLSEVNGRFVAFVQEKPLVALGAACAIGYVLGRVLRRVV